MMNPGFQPGGIDAANDGGDFPPMSAASKAVIPAKAGIRNGRVFHPSGFQQDNHGGCPYMRGAYMRPLRVKYPGGEKAGGGFVFA